jgi:hypothetical protein
LGRTDKQDVDDPKLQMMAEVCERRRERRTPACAVGPQALAKRRFLTFEESGGEVVAIPLERVERIESVPVTSIGWAAGHVLRRSSGKIVRLEDRCGVLAGLPEVSEEESAGLTVTVLVCKWRVPGVRGVRRLGVVVGRVMPVATGDLIETPVGLELAMAGGGKAWVHEVFAGKKKRRGARMAVAA